MGPGNRRPYRFRDERGFHPIRADRALGDDDEMLAGHPAALDTLRWADGEGRNEAVPNSRRRLADSGFDVDRVVVAAVDDDQILDTAGHIEFAIKINAEISSRKPGFVVGNTVGMARVRQSGLKLVGEHPLRLVGGVSNTLARYCCRATRFRPPTRRATRHRQRSRR